MKTSFRTILASLVVEFVSIGTATTPSGMVKGFGSP
jgi:hypothetical protein